MNIKWRNGSLIMMLEEGFMIQRFVPTSQLDDDWKFNDMNIKQRPTLGLFVKIIELNIMIIFDLKI